MSGRGGGAGVVAMGLAATAWAAPPVVRTGVDVLVAQGFKPLAGKRVGLITNPTGVTWNLNSTADVLHAAKEVKLVALYGPEHGIRGDTHAGNAVADSKDPATGVPVLSLYSGDSGKPTRKMLAGIDALVYDIQDNGSRSYTYITTMAKCMEAAAEQGLEFFVLDRPNPLTGHRMEGSPLNLEFRSAVGYLAVPYLYGMTCGELATMINGEGWLENKVHCKLTVIKMEGWRRDMWFEDTGLCWVPPSPHVPRADSSMYYAATGIMGELQVISEGVGYTLPFELAGAAFIDPNKLASELNARKLPGVLFRPIYWKPYYIRDVGTQYGGVQVHITDRKAVHLTSIQFHVMDIVQKLYPDKALFGSKRDNMFDKVCGTDAIRKAFLAKQPLSEILARWDSGVQEFASQRAKYLLYK